MAQITVKFIYYEFGNICINVLKVWSFFHYRLALVCFLASAYKSFGRFLVRTMTTMFDIFGEILAIFSLVLHFLRSAAEFSKL
jgi:hypothetical protein